MTQELLNVDLPKWPQMLVWGAPVSEARAKDVILRTDRFLSDLSEYAGGNNHRWNAWARNELGIGETVNKLLRSHNGEQKVDWQLQYAVQSRFQELLGCVSTEYVHNNWASCSFIFGPHGWMHPNGAVSFIDNVGKWPSVSEVLDDWKALARAFSYLDLHATLMSGESCEEDARPVVTIRVLDGKASLLAPLMPDQPVRRRDIGKVLPGFLTPGREQGLPDAWIREFGEITRPLLERAFEESKQAAEAREKTGE
jgi:hypothetical protein